MRWLLLMTLLGCAPKSPTVCESSTTETTYSCQPTSERVASCRGLDTEKAFPIGCGVAVPGCSPFEPALTAAYECVIGADGKPDWYEPI